MTPGRRKVPRATETEGSAPDENSPPSRLVAQLRPWIDLDAVGLTGLYRWLESIVPLLPAPEGGATKVHADPEARVRQLSRALAASAGNEARAHFQASEYFRENRVLARRLLALEAVLRTRGTPVPARSRDIDASLRRYVPHRDEP